MVELALLRHFASVSQSRMSRRQVQNAGHRSGHRAQVTGHRAQGTGHRAQVTGHRAQVIGHRKRSKNS